MKIRVSIAIGILSITAVSTRAVADTFVNPLDTVPKPNVVIGFDHSVTMGIQRNCSNCHGAASDAIGATPRTRLGDAKADLLQTAPLFQDYFVFGGFTYKGCGYAEVDARVLPNSANPDTSFAALFGNPVGSGGLITNVTHCGSRENSLPNSASAWTNCITPSTGCVGDWPFIQNVLGAGGAAIPGLNITQPAVITSTTCDNPATIGPTYNVQAALIAKFAGGTFQWPRWDTSSLSAADVQTDFCTPAANVFAQIQTELAQCSLTPNAIWDMSFLGGTWCDAAQIAGNICTPSRLGNTCVCDQTVTGLGGETCFSAGLVNSDCGTPLQFKARQQVAVCELVSIQSGSFGDFFINDPLNALDNRVNGPLPNFCRENVGMVFTDGYMGDTLGVQAEALKAVMAGTYQSASGLSNLFVFRIADPVPDLASFIAAADAMQDELAGPTGLTQALLANDAPAMQGSFAQVLSRVFKGVYTGASLTLDEYGTRAYVTSFTVPGYSTTLPVSGCATPPCTGDTYIGWPQRLSAYAVDPISGALGPLQWETDWSSRVSATSCGPNTIGTPDVTVLGPGGNFRNGVSRNITITAPIDRTGDGIVDPIPPGASGYTWGRAFGFAATEPVVVDAPREAIGGDQGGTFALHQAAVRTRRRAVYVQAGGYLVGYDGGDYDSTPTTYGTGANLQKVAFGYTEDGNTGAEILRYIPSWVNDANADYQYALNDLVQQPILSGDLEAREVYDGTRWRTVLAGSAGYKGRGYFALDVTDPCTPALLGEWVLPGLSDRASNEPRIYTVPTAAGPRPAVIVTGGLNGSGNLYAFALDGSMQYAPYALDTAGTASYATTPVCVDARGEGYVTHCYALRTDGYLQRVEVRPAGFAGKVDITPNPANVPGYGMVSPIGGGRRYSTLPVAFFSADGAVNLVFGSGDFENLTVGGPQNFVFKVTDEGIRKKTVPNTRADVTTSCYPDGGTGPTVGIFPLGASERLISSPAVVGGGVFWAAYAPTNNGCIKGNGSLYGMNFESCYDILTPSQNRPSPISGGPGIPLTPTVHRRSNTVFAQSTAAPAAADMGAQSAQLRGGLKPVVKRLYWRPLIDIR